METIGIHGIITIHRIPEWTDEELTYWWARMSDEAKAQRQVAEPVENMLTNTGIVRFLANNSKSGQGNMYPFAQILSVGNGAFTGASRELTAVSGDGFTTGARKAPASDTQIGFQSTLVFNFASGDAVGTWTNAGLYGFKTSSSQNATTTTATGSLMSIAAYPFVKGSTAYAVQYVLSLQN
jgi:hypothetical protein